jgi:hypothetical protein
MDGKRSAQSGSGWLVASPIIATGIALLSANAGYRIGADLNLGYEWGRRMAFLALGVGTGLVAFACILMTNYVREVRTHWRAAILWALGAGVLGTVVFHVILGILMRIAFA